MRAIIRRACVVTCVLGVPGVVSAQGLRTVGALLPVASPRSSPAFVVRPADEASPRPVTVYLHGLWGDPRPGCSYFRHFVTDRSWLACPMSPGRLPNGGASWTGSVAARLATVDRARRSPSALTPTGVDLERGAVLIGFSQGAYEALRQARARPGRWRAVAFIGAYIHVTRAQLDAAGVRRAVFAAGRYDETWRTLRDTAERLQAEGYDARFVDLGLRGHGYAARPEARAAWREALTWLEETD